MAMMLLLLLLSMIPFVFPCVLSFRWIVVLQLVSCESSEASASMCTSCGQVGSGKGRHGRISHYVTILVENGCGFFAPVLPVPSVFKKLCAEGAASGCERLYTHHMAWVMASNMPLMAIAFMICFYFLGRGFFGRGFAK